jgi:hypothetical protein
LRYDIFFMRSVGKSSSLRGRWIALAAGVLGLAVCAWAAALVLPPWIAESRLIGRLDSGDKEAVEKLVEMGSVRAIPRLLEMWWREPPFGDAAERICRKRGGAAVTWLIKTIDEGEDPVRDKAIDLIAEIGPEMAGAAPRLLELLEHPDAKVRVRAADALWAIEKIGVRPAQSSG